MLGFLGRLVGTEKAVNDILDKDTGHLARAGEWVGNLNYTEEEKAEARADTRKWGLLQLEALAPFKVVQRLLAGAAATFWIFVGVNIVVAIWLEAITRKQVMFNDQLVWSSIDAKTDLLAFAMSDYVFWPVAIVFALYFAGGVIPERKK